MDENPSEETTIVAMYSTRHDAEIAKSFLEDHGIDAFVVADDVHVPLQVTEGARLIVMQSKAERAHEALADVRLLPDSFAEPEYLIDENLDADAEGTAPLPASSRERRRPLKSSERATIATLVATLVVVMLFFIPWRIDRNNEIVWAPFYRPPITHTTTFQELGGARVNYEKGEVAYDILLLQVLGVLAVGLASSLLMRVAPKDEIGDKSSSST